MADPHLPQIPIAERVLIYHQRRNIGSCTCGWGVDTGDAGKSHPAHVLSVLRDHPDVVDGMARAIAAAEDDDSRFWRRWQPTARAALAYLTGVEAGDDR